MNETEKTLEAQANNSVLKEIFKIITNKARGNAIAEENLAIAVRDGKNLDGALKQLEKAARKNEAMHIGTTRICVVGPSDAEKIICEYFEVPLNPLPNVATPSEPLSLLDII